jgi:hypothetical protein
MNAPIRVVGKAGSSLQSLQAFSPSDCGSHRTRPGVDQNPSEEAPHIRFFTFALCLIASQISQSIARTGNHLQYREKHITETRDRYLAQNIIFTMRGCQFYRFMHEMPVCC